MNFTKTTNELFKKYGLKPENVIVAGACGADEKISLIYYLLLAYEFARKNLLKGNLTASSYACGLVLDDDSVHFGVNFNNTRNEISSICAERLAMLEAFNSKVKEYRPELKQKFNYKIKYVLMASYKKEGAFWVDKITPCADCLSWFDKSENLSVDTKICSLKINSENKIILDIQHIEKFLPLRNLSYNVFNPDNRPIKISKSRNSEILKISNEEIIKLYEAVYHAYKNNLLSKTSEQNVAAGVISNGEIFTGVKVDFSKRWFIEPLMAASYKAIEKFGLKTQIGAVCFIGDEYTTTESNLTVRDGIISLKTLGRINTKFASDETLVITGGKDGIRVETIGDYMPCEHKFIHNYEIK